MTIRLKLYINSLVLFVLLAMLVVIISIYSSKQTADLALAGHASEFAQNIAKLDMLSQEFITFNENRMLRQWHTLRDKIANTTEVMTTLHDYKTFELSLKSLDKAFKFHQDIFQAHQQALKTKTLTIDEQQRYVLLEQRTAARIRIDTQKLTGLAFKTATAARQNVLQLEQQRHIIILVVATIVILVAFGSAIGITRNISKSLETLISLAQTSDSDPRLTPQRISGRDEITLVSSTINKMLSTIGEQKSALADVNKNLEKIVATRTVQLEQTNKELETFSYTISHDLKAPLRSIDSFSLILLEDCADQLSGEGKDFLIRIRNNTRQMSELIEGLLALSHVSRGVLNLKPIDLSAMAQAIIEDLRVRTPEREVNVSIEKGLVANVDSKLVRSVFQNLIHNAWKYTSKTANARIKLGMLKQNGENIFYLEDNGIGFNMRFATKLFGAFQRMHNVADISGTGIGLATVQRIIHRHGGRIWAEAEEGNGATFFFTLPEAITLGEHKNPGGNTQ